MESDFDTYSYEEDAASTDDTKDSLDMQQLYTVYVSLKDFFVRGFYYCPMAKSSVQGFAKLVIKQTKNGDHCNCPYSTIPCHRMSQCKKFIQFKKDHEEIISRAHEKYCQNLLDHDRFLKYCFRTREECICKDLDCQ